jgi:hypothetical protein
MSDLLKSLAFPVLLVFDYIFLCYYTWRSCHAFHRMFPEWHFYFRITDIWAAMIGLTPALLVTGDVFNQNAPQWQMFGLLILIPTQLVWMFKGRLLAQETERLTGGHNPIESAVSIIGGAAWAIPFTILCAICLTTCLPAFVLYMILYARRQVREEFAH